MKYRYHIENTFTDSGLHHAFELWDNDTETKLFTTTDGISPDHLSRLSWIREAIEMVHAVCEYHKAVNSNPASIEGQQEHQQKTLRLEKHALGCIAWLFSDPEMETLLNILENR